MATVREWTEQELEHATRNSYGSVELYQKSLQWYNTYEERTVYEVTGLFEDPVIYETREEIAPWMEGIDEPDEVHITELTMTGQAVGDLEYCDV